MRDTYDHPKIYRILVSAMKKTFVRSAQYAETMYRAKKELPRKIKKNGEDYSKSNYSYECNMCKNWFKSYQVEVDHIDPVVRLDKEDYNHTLDEIAERLYCDLDNLQVLCSIKKDDNNGVLSCHKLKSAEEKFIRDRIKEWRKNGDSSLLTEDKLVELCNDYRKKLTELEIDKLRRCGR